MYELKKNGKVFTSKSVGTGPSSFEKRILPGRDLTKVEKHCLRWNIFLKISFPVIYNLIAIIP